MSPHSPALEPVHRRSNGLRTRAEIVAVAERHFAERGFEATRLDDIATEVGIRRAAIFYHFGDKQEVYTPEERQLVDPVRSRCTVAALRAQAKGVDLTPPRSSTW